jgi:hypothetical protein
MLQKFQKLPILFLLHKDEIDYCRIMNLKIQFLKISNKEWVIYCIKKAGFFKPAFYISSNRYEVNSLL